MSDSLGLPPELSAYMDTESALSRIRGNRSLLKKLLQSFLDSAYMDKLNAAVAQDDLTGAEHWAHSIKGVCANLSLTSMHQCALQLDTRLKSGDPYAGELAALRQAACTTDALIRQLIETL